MTANKKNTKNKFNKYALLFLGYAVICLITSMFLNSAAGEKMQKTLPASGGIIGPVETQDDNDVYLIRVMQRVRSYGDWAFVEGEVLDKNKQYLFSFGDEFWKETGYDSDGRWYEEKKQFKMKVTFKEKGDYYLNFKTETSKPNAGNNLAVQVVPIKASSLAHLWLAVLSLVACLIMWAIARNV